jgi:hypothetical protein
MIYFRGFAGSCGGGRFRSGVQGVYLFAFQQPAAAAMVVVVLWIMERNGMECVIYRHFLFSALDPACEWICSVQCEDLMWIINIEGQWGEIGWLCCVEFMIAVRLGLLLDWHRALYAWQEEKSTVSYGGAEITTMYRGIVEEGRVQYFTARWGGGITTQSTRRDARRRRRLRSETHLLFYIRIFMRLGNGCVFHLYALEHSWFSTFSLYCWN